MAKKKESPDHGALLKKLLLTVFKEYPYKALNYKQAIRKLQQEPLYEESKELLELLDAAQLKAACIAVLEGMTQDQVLQEVDRYKYKLWPQSHFAEGRIDIVSNGNAYVKCDEFEEDVVVDRNNTKNAMKGDLVKINLFATRPGKRQEGEVIEVLERARTEFVGTVQVSGKFAFLSGDSGKNSVEIFIPLNALNGAVHGEKAIARITEWPEEAKNPQGEIIRVLGAPGENNVEMDAILVEYGFPLEFPAEVEAEAEKIPFKISAAEIKKRRDFRKVPTFTIDPVDAKDFDDALSVQTLKNGNLEVGIHIADVSHYVTPSSSLEEEAFDRATSIYLVDRVIPMLPEKLSNNVCSLRPGEDKLCFSAVFEIDKEAKVLEEWFGRTVIHSQRRFSYEEAQEVIETGKGDMEEYILPLQELAKILRKNRFTSGAISFDRVEVKFRLDERAHPVDVFLKENKDSNKLIEEFMLLANRRVAEYIGKKLSIKEGKEYPFVYRIHDTPVSDKMETFANFASKFGYKMNTNTDREIAHSLNKLMKDVKGKKEQNVIEQLAIRTMSKAVYTTNNIGHYGLAFDYYTHFTSPIRRYPDVMVHRLLAHYLAGGKPMAANDLEVACKHSTDMEIKASEAERASIKFKQVQYLLDRKDEVFNGMISGVTEWGLYVEVVDSKCEGLIRVRDLVDDFYELNEDQYCLVGHRSKKVYQLGDLLKVRLKSADLMKKQIDFVLAEDYNSVKLTKSGGGGNFSKFHGGGSSKSSSRSSSGSSSKSGSPKSKNKYGKGSSKWKK
ncbi:MAG: ribonuclease R [Bacteroidetes bacterium]|nr:ribonuclease R [Bacteroidota bacterium]